MKKKGGKRGKKVAKMMIKIGKKEKILQIMKKKAIIEKIAWKIK